VYREPFTEATALERDPARHARSDAEFSRSHTINNTALFRYSALTFNGHRIHYDSDYARDIEGYPNLVIHGPLIATLLIDLCAAQPVKRFRYQASSPLFLPDTFTVNARHENGVIQMWAANHRGELAMHAEAT
jgi:3-methylfumaryl-CoA hydratase